MLNGRGDEQPVFGSRQPGSSGSGQTSSTFSVASGQSAATRLPSLSSQTGKRIPRIPSCSGSSSVGGSLPSSSRLTADADSFRSLQAGTGPRPANHAPSYACGTRIARQARFIHHRAGLKHVIDLIQERYRAGETKLPGNGRAVRASGPDSDDIAGIQADGPCIPVAIAGARFPRQRRNPGSALSGRGCASLARMRRIIHAAPAITADVRSADRPAVNAAGPPYPDAQRRYRRQRYQPGVRLRPRDQREVGLCPAGRMSGNPALLSIPAKRFGPYASRTCTAGRLRNAPGFAHTDRPMEAAVKVAGTIIPVFLEHPVITKRDGSDHRPAPCHR